MRTRDVRLGVTGIEGEDIPGVWMDVTPGRVGNLDDARVYTPELLEWFIDAVEVGVQMWARAVPAHRDAPTGVREIGRTT